MYIGRGRPQYRVLDRRFGQNSRDALACGNLFDCHTGVRRQSEKKRLCSICVLVLKMIVIQEKRSISASVPQDLCPPVQSIAELFRKDSVVLLFLPSSESLFQFIFQMTI